MTFDAAGTAERTRLVVARLDLVEVLRSVLARPGLVLGAPLGANMHTGELLAGPACELPVVGPALLVGRSSPERLLADAVGEGPHAALALDPSGRRLRWRATWRATPEGPATEEQRNRIRR